MKLNKARSRNEQTTGLRNKGGTQPCGRQLATSRLLAKKAQSLTYHPTTTRDGSDKMKAKE